MQPPRPPLFTDEEAESQRAHSTCQNPRAGRVEPEINTWGHLFPKLTTSSVPAAGTFSGLSFSGGELGKEYSRPKIMLVWHCQVNMKLPSQVLEGNDSQQAAAQLLLGTLSDGELSPLNKDFSYYV